MPKASVKRNINKKKDKLIEFVLDIEKYPIFVPYCIDAKIHQKNDTCDFVNIIADLTIGKGLFKDTYKSDVKFNKKNNSIYVKNIDGPLKYLDNKWTFEDHKEGTEIYFDVDFEIKNKFLIVFKDQGPGFKEKNIENIFKRFYSNRPKNFGEHSGLGLNIVRNIIELHKGKIKALNRPDIKGAQIEETLPKFS